MTDNGLTTRERIKRRAREVLEEAMAEMRRSQAPAALKLYGPDAVDEESLALHVRAEEILGKAGYTLEEYAEALDQAAAEQEKPAEAPPKALDGDELDRKAWEVLRRGGNFAPSHQEYAEALEIARRELGGSGR